MSNTPNQQKKKDTMTAKLAKHFTLAKSLAPDIPNQSDNKFKKIFACFKGNYAQMVSLNMMLMIFALPLIVFFFILLPNKESAAIAGYTMTGGLGIGFGVTDQTLEAFKAVYDLRKLFVLYFLTPSMMVMSIGASGIYHCCRNLMWGSKVKTFKHFFRGIRLHWWKFLLTYTFIGLVGTSVGYSLVELQSQITLTGSAGAGVWVWLIGSGIIALLTAMFMMIFQPNMISYKIKYKDTIKNSLILCMILFVTTLFVTVALAAPFLLVLVSFFKIIVYIIMLVLGGVLLVLCNVAFGQYASENFVDMLFEYEEQNRIRTIRAEKQAEKQSKAKEAKVKPPYKKKKK